MELINSTLNLSFCALALLLLMYAWTTPLKVSRITVINRGILTGTFLLLFFDGIAGEFLSDQPFFYNLIITVSLICYYIILAFDSVYIISVVQEKSRLTDMALLLNFLLCALGSVLLISNLFVPYFVDAVSKTILNPQLHRLVEITGFLIMVTDLLLLLRYHNRISSIEKMSLAMLPFSLPLYLFFKWLVPGLRIRNVLLFIIILCNHMFIGRNRDMELWNKEQQLAEYRYILSLERVKPHYIYNVLTSIYYLCDSDPKKAQSAVKTFSEYLRKSLYTMDQTKTVPFQWEMDLVRNYLSLETMRFPDNFQVDYMIAERDFELPPFTVQILVENAVKHAVSRRKDQNGRIRIAAEKTAGGYRIEVTDNGTGQIAAVVSSGEKMPGEYESIGLNNVRERLALLCGGTLTIQPNGENGITSSIFLPFPDTGR